MCACGRGGGGGGERKRGGEGRGGGLVSYADLRKKGVWKRDDLMWIDDHQNAGVITRTVLRAI